MAADVWAEGGAGTLTATLTTNLNTTAKDRMLVVHVATDATAINLTLDDGTKKLANAVPIPANDTRDFGPYFLKSGTNLRGGADSAHGDWRIDELQVNQ